MDSWKVMEALLKAGSFRDTIMYCEEFDVLCMWSVGEGLLRFTDHIKQRDCPVIGHIDVDTFRRPSVSDVK